VEHGIEPYMAGGLARPEAGSQCGSGRGRH
jgi:hypothetical protein